VAAQNLPDVFACEIFKLKKSLRQNPTLNAALQGEMSKKILLDSMRHCQLSQGLRIHACLPDCII